MKKFFGIPPPKGSTSSPGPSTKHKRHRRSPSTPDSQPPNKSHRSNTRSSSSRHKSATGPSESERLDGNSGYADASLQNDDMRSQQMYLPSSDVIEEEYLSSEGENHSQSGGEQDPSIQSAEYNVGQYGAQNKGKAPAGDDQAYNQSMRPQDFESRGQELLSNQQWHEESAEYDETRYGSKEKGKAPVGYDQSYPHDEQTEYPTMPTNQEYDYGNQEYENQHHQTPRSEIVVPVGLRSMVQSERVPVEQRLNPPRSIDPEVRSEVYTRSDQFKKHERPISNLWACHVTEASARKDFWWKPNSNKPTELVDTWLHADHHDEAEEGNSHNCVAKEEIRETHNDAKSIITFFTKDRNTGERSIGDEADPGQRAVSYVVRRDQKGTVTVENPGEILTLFQCAIPDVDGHFVLGSIKKYKPSSRGSTGCDIQNSVKGVRSKRVGFSLNSTADLVKAAALVVAPNEDVPLDELVRRIRGEEWVNTEINSALRLKEGQLECKRGNDWWFCWREDGWWFRSTILFLRERDTGRTEFHLENWGWRHF